MTRRVRISIGDVVSEAQLFDDKAPQTVNGLWESLPFTEKTIQTRWSGDAWRTEREHKLTSPDAGVENVADRLGPGDIIYFPTYAQDRYKVGVAYGQARWLNPFCVPLDVAHIGRIDIGLEGFVTACERIIFDGPLTVTFERID